MACMGGLSEESVFSLKWTWQHGAGLQNCIWTNNKTLPDNAQHHIWQKTSTVFARHWAHWAYWYSGSQPDGNAVMKSFRELCITNVCKQLKETNVVPQLTESCTTAQSESFDVFTQQYISIFCLSYSKPEVLCFLYFCSGQRATLLFLAMQLVRSK